MARITYASLFLNFAPDATDTPKIADINLLITNYYKQAYNIVYGVNTYAATDDATSDPQTIIRSEELNSEFEAELSKKVQQWHDSGLTSQGEVIKMPSFKISKLLKKTIENMTGRVLSRITNIRIYGSDYDDMGVI